MKTKQYSKFVVAADNRMIDPRNVREKERLLEKYGWLKSFPMSVARRGGKYVIRDGHHRFLAAQKLGVAVNYVVDDVAFDIAEINTRGVRKWRLLDTVDRYAREGNVEYQKLLAFMSETGLPVSPAARALGSEYASALNRGEFVASHEDRGRVIARIIVGIRDDVKFATHTLFISALHSVAQVDGFDSKRFIEQATRYPTMMRKSADVDTYRQEIEKVYNYRRKLRNLPLAFLGAAVSKANGRKGASV